MPKFGRAGWPAKGHSVKIDRRSVNVRSTTLERPLTGEPSDCSGSGPVVEAKPSAGGQSRSLETSGRPPKSGHWRAGRSTSSGGVPRQPPITRSPSLLPAAPPAL